MQTRYFPQNFLWGSATSSHQVEGNNTRNDWWLWEQTPGNIAGNHRSGDACLWWSGQAEKDLAQAAKLGQKAHRLSLEWSRLEPTPGKYNEKAFERYRNILSTIRALGMKTMVTLYHFTLPQWACQKSSWLDRTLIRHFENYTRECARRLGDLVDLWCTINEPMVLCMMGYGDKKWPPGCNSLRLMVSALHNLMIAHARSYRALHEVIPNAKVGLVLNMAKIKPNSRRAKDFLVAWLQDWIKNGAILHALQEGFKFIPVGFMPFPVSEIRYTYDFIGINYYGMYQVKFDIKNPAMLFGTHIQNSVKTEENDWGEIYPDGLKEQLLRLKKLRCPIYITENGVYDAEDKIRPHYLLQHIESVHKAIELGVDIRGYFHWSLVDNFEWAEGWFTPFGLIELDRETQKRTIKRSGRIYSEICNSNCLKSTNPQDYVV